MIFDTLCKIIEKFVPEAMHILKEAKLFQFPKRPHEVFNKYYSQAECDLLNNEFFLPFPIVAIEDPGSCIVFSDSQKQAFGTVNVRRTFLECMPVDKENYSDFGIHGTMTEKEYNDTRRPKGTCMIVFGDFESIKFFDDSATLTNGRITYFAELSPEGVVMDHYRGAEVIKKISQDGNLDHFFKNPRVAIEEIMYFNNPDKFIIEVSPKKPRDQSKSRLIARSHERPIYTYISPKKIRELTGLKGTTGEHHAAHPRRAHWRTYQHDRYIKMKGQRVHIESTWVGPHEAQVGNKRYKVLVNV